MSTSLSSLYGAFRAMLSAISPRPSVVYWMGESIAEEHSEPALAERFSVSSYMNPTIGGGGPIEQTGTYMVAVIEPFANGSADTYRLLANLDAVVSAFRVGTTVDDGLGNPASILSVEISGPVKQPTHVTYSAMFRWDRFPPNA